MRNNQRINCSIKSCAYNREGLDCELGSIEVAPVSGSSGCSCARESMCSSYSCKDK